MFSPKRKWLQHVFGACILSEGLEGFNKTRLSVSKSSKFGFRNSIKRFACKLWEGATHLIIIIGDNVYLLQRRTWGGPCIKNHRTIGNFVITRLLLFSQNVYTFAKKGENVTLKGTSLKSFKNAVVLLFRNYCCKLPCHFAIQVFFTAKVKMIFLRSHYEIINQIKLNFRSPNI